MSNNPAKHLGIAALYVLVICALILVAPIYLGVQVILSLFLNAAEGIVSWWSKR